jgi:pimeloyl-ACP methyl ester carboxylesterase
MHPFELKSGFRDLSIESEGITLAVRDFGGSGDPVLLLHGLGRTVVDWSVLGPLLKPYARPVALDLRGHGKSGDGPWTWDLALGDLEALAGQLNLGTPAVVGHSLGGMLAVMWARKHAGALAVNLDGHGQRTLSQYAGISEDDARRRVAAAEDRVKAALGALDGPLPPALVKGLMTQQRALATQFHAPEEMFIEAMERTLDQRDGAAYLRPSPVGLGAEILAAAESFDMFALYRAIERPLLIVAGSDPDPGADPELMAAYRRGLKSDLQRLSSERPNVTVEFLPGGHGLLFEHPEDLARRIATFLTAS